MDPRGFIDALGLPWAVVDTSGVVLHAPRLDVAAAELLGAIADAARACTSAAPEPGTPTVTRVAVEGAEHTLTATPFPAPGGDAPPLVVVWLEGPGAGGRGWCPIGAYGLTPAEGRVAHQLAAGRSNAEIAAALGISPHTARRHTERILEKTGARSRAEAVRRLLMPDP